MRTVKSRKSTCNDHFQKRICTERRGNKMLILEDGTLIDTIGGGCAESDVITKALLMMREEKVRFQICMVDMAREAAEEEGMVCGGRIEVMLERV